MCYEDVCYENPEMGHPMDEDGFYIDVLAEDDTGMSLEEAKKSVSEAPDVEIRESIICIAFYSLESESDQGRFIKFLQKNFPEELKSFCRTMAKSVK